MADENANIHVPGSASEVSIRTMESDIESMGRAGGGLPVGASVSVPVQAPMIRQTYPTAQKTEGEAPAVTVAAKSSSTKALLITALITIPILFLVGFFILPAILKQKAQQPVAQQPPGTLPVAPPPAGGPTSTPTSPVPVSPPAPTFAHNTFFSQSAKPDAVLTLRVNEIGTTTLVQQITAAAKTASSSAGFFELALQDINGNALSLPQFLSAFSLNVFDGAFLSTNFSPDVTGFVMKDAKGGLWPGFIAKLQSGKLPLLLQPQIVSQVEKTPAALTGLFVSSPGTARAFSDAQANGIPVRVLMFGNAPAAFTYGFVKASYLVGASSLDAFRAAAAHL